MATKKQDQLKIAKERLSIAETGLLQKYYEAIREKYEKHNPVGKNEILEGLERVLTGKEIIKSIEPFNPKKAAITRVMSELNQKSLAKKLGVSQSTIAQYETGQIIPSYPMTKHMEKYLDWLASRGYNPYNIPFPSLK